MTDDDLRTALRRGDPAADLPPLHEGDRAALLQRAAAAPRPRPRWGLALGALAAAGAVAVASVVLIPRPNDLPAGVVVTLTAPAADPTAICAPLDDSAVEALRSTDLAFSARVTTVSGTQVELVPIDVFRGPAPDLVRLRTDTGGGPALDGPILRQGDRVLVAATDGEVAGCGLSAAESADLLRYYEAAF